MSHSDRNSAPPQLLLELIMKTIGGNELPKINGADTLTELIEPDSAPAVVRIVWPISATITTPARYLEVASAAMRLLAEASTTLARIRASRRL
jgi:hypothetical protein